MNPMKGEFLCMTTLQTNVTISLIKIKKLAISIKILRIINKIELNYRDLLIFLIPCIIFGIYLYVFNPGIIYFDTKLNHQVLYRKNAIVEFEKKESDRTSWLS